MRGAWRVVSSFARKLNVMYHIRVYQRTVRMNGSLFERNEVLENRLQDAHDTVYELRDVITSVQGPNLERAVIETLDRMPREALSWRQ